MPCNSNMDIVSSCLEAVVSDESYYGWRCEYVGMDRARLFEMKNFEKENQLLQKIAAELELDTIVSWRKSRLFKGKIGAFGSRRSGYSCTPKTWYLKTPSLCSSGHSSLDDAV